MRNIELDQADSLDFPSLAYDYEKTLHATYTCEDTVRYAFRTADAANWTVRSDPFYPDGDSSGHPFIETYGDSIFIVWQCAADTEVYRGTKDLDEPGFEKDNISLTSSTPSIFPVNASGFATVFSDKAPSLSYYDIFWRSYPDSQLQNLSNTASIQSIYTQADLKITEENPPHLYTAWQEGNAIPYAIEFTSTDLTERSFPDYQSTPAYYVTTPGQEAPSRHLAARDSFISTWQMPVDVGKLEIVYKFRLDPDYIYELSATAYHEYHNTWSMDVLIDQEKVGNIEYFNNMPEKLDLLIKPEFYQDSIIEVMFKTTEGQFSALAALNIYRYEGKNAKHISPENRNTQGHEISWLNNISIYPSLFKEQLHVQYQCTQKQDLAIQIFDICGRIIRDITPNSQVTAQGLSTYVWNGTDSHGEKVAAGVYFLRIADKKTGTSTCCKVLKID